MIESVIEIEGESYRVSKKGQCANDRERVCMCERGQERKQKETLFGII